MAQSSIHVCPVKAGSEQHNSREKSLDYVHSSLSHLNESVRYSATSIDQRLSEIAKDYADYHHKKLHSKATPIREGVVVIDEQVSMADLERACQTCKDKFGINAMQIYIHRDEGHLDDKTKKWKPNLHAHIVFDWYDWNTHTTFKLSRQDTAKMQTIFADELRMERGNASDKEYLTAQQYKIGKEIERLNERLSEAQKTGLIDSLKVAALDKVECSQTYKNMQSDKNNLTAELATARTERDKAHEQIEGLKRGNLVFSDRIDELESEKEQLQERYRTIQEQSEQDNLWTNAWNDIRAMARGTRTGTGNIRNAIAKIVEWVKVGYRMAADILLNMCTGINHHDEEDIRPTLYQIADTMESRERQSQSFGRGL